MSLLKTLTYDEIDFECYGSQQFATVSFDRNEDGEKTLITIIKDGKIKQIDGDNKYNRSARRHSSCVYVKEECDQKFIKICTIQHKGETLIEIHEVDEEEILYLFADYNKCV